MSFHRYIPHVYKYILQLSVDIDQFPPPRLAAPVRGVAVRADKERYVIVLAGILDLECNLYCISSRLLDK